MERCYCGLLGRCVKLHILRIDLTFRLRIYEHEARCALYVAVGDIEDAGREVRIVAYTQESRHVRL